MRNGDCTGNNGNGQGQGKCNKPKHKDREAAAARAFQQGALNPLMVDAQAALLPRRATLLQPPELRQQPAADGRGRVIDVGNPLIERHVRHGLRGWDRRRSTGSGASWSCPQRYPMGCCSRSRPGTRRTRAQAHSRRRGMYFTPIVLRPTNISAG